jgi:hypothetical protein
LQNHQGTKALETMKQRENMKEALAMHNQGQVNKCILHKREVKKKNSNDTVFNSDHNFGGKFPNHEKIRSRHTLSTTSTLAWRSKSMETIAALLFQQASISAVFPHFKQGRKMVAWQKSQIGMNERGTRQILEQCQRPLIPHISHHWVHGINDGIVLDKLCGDGRVAVRTGEHQCRFPILQWQNIDEGSN